MKKENEYQIGGDHYLEIGLQPWEVLKVWLSTEGFNDYLLGNAIKYCARYKKKGGVHDIKKAIHYLEKLASELEGKNEL